MPIQKVFFKNNKGLKLAAWLHTPAGDGPFPAVIRTHGYRSNKEGRTSVVLAEKFTNFIYFRFDMHGHGESEGNPEEIDALQCAHDVQSAIEYVRSLPSVDKKRIALTGSSLGGMAVLLAAAWEDVAAVVPVCPVTDFHPFKKSDVKYKSLIAQLASENIYKEAEKISSPTCVIHGDNDTVVPIMQSIELIRHLKEGTLHIIPGADHIFSNEKNFQQMIQHTVDFILSKL